MDPARADFHEKPYEQVAPGVSATSGPPGANAALRQIKVPVGIGRSLFLSVLAVVASDKKITRRERLFLRSIQKRLGVPDETAQECLDELRKGRRTVLIPGSPSDRDSFLDLLIQAAASDLEVSAQEIRLLKQVGQRLGVSGEAIERRILAVLRQAANPAPARAEVSSTPVAPQAAPPSLRAPPPTPRRGSVAIAKQPQASVRSPGAIIASAKAALSRPRLRRAAYVVGAIALLVLVSIAYDVVCDYRAYSKAKAKDTPQSYRSYLSSYPKGAHASEARARLDDVAFAQASSRNTLTSFEAYAKEFPSGRHAREAGKQIARLRFEGAVEMGTFRALRKFIEANPDSPYLGEARSRLSALGKETRDRYVSAAQQTHVREDAFVVFAALLDYVCVTGHTTVPVVFRGEASVRDYAGFTPPEKAKWDEIIRGNRRAFTYQANPITKLPSEMGVPSIQRALDPEKMSPRHGRFCQRMSQLVGLYFGDSSVISFCVAQQAPADSQAYMSATYRVTNKPGPEGLPSLYTVITTTTLNGVPMPPTFQGYLVGVDIHWECQVHVPSASRSYVYHLTSGAAEHIQGGGYDQMLDSVFEEAQVELLKSLGLNEGRTLVSDGS